MTTDVVAGRYRLDERVGVGGMAEVWAAQDLELDRRVALKLLARDADPARFDREARAAAALSDPNICQLYDYGKAPDGRPYMVLEYLPGGTLEDRLPAGRPLDDEDAAKVAGELAGALAHAHARGLVHRDLKPANVLFDLEGRAKIADFGIARLSGAGTLTDAGTVLGTAAYISPEQASGEPASAASDVYSFGVILYRILTGRLPFESEEPLALARKHVTETPRPVAELRPDAPPRLAQLAMAALAKRPDGRPRDGGALAAFLADGAAAKTAVLATGPSATARTAVLPRIRGPRRLGLAAAAVLGLAGLAAAGIGLALLATGGGSPAPAPRAPHAARSTRTKRPPTRPAATGPTTHPQTTKSTQSETRTAPPAPPPPPPPTTAPTTITTPTTTPTTPPPPPTTVTTVTT